MRRSTLFAILVIVGCWTNAVGAAAQTCAANGVALQILGSNGPRLKPDRPSASASYLIWVDGRSRILVDVGGGAFLRFVEAAGSRIFR